VKVFISWSGEQSRQVALALHEWLPQALHAAKPYMSEMDTEAGGLWDYILSAELEATDFGVVCLTPTNLESRWLNFEAGALSKAVTKARVVPLLFGLKNANVGLPLSRFQMKTASRQGIFDVVKTINANAEQDRKVDEATLIGIFESVWPKLEAKLNAVPDGQEALLEEILDFVRSSTMRASPDFRNARTGLHVTTPRLKRLAEIAEKEGVVIVEGNKLIAQCPRFADGGRDLDPEEHKFLDNLASYLHRQGARLELVGEDEL
jgi:hypothetical protein